MNRKVSLPASLLNRILFRVFKAMSCGAILLDEHKRLVRINARAESCFCGSLLIRGGQLAAVDGASDGHFQNMLDEALRAHDGGAPSSPSAVALRRSEQRPLIARAVRVEPEARAEMEGAALLLMLVDPEDCPALSHTMLQRVFGLTRGEARVANRLICGSSLQEIAEAAQVSVGTVRSQTKALFAKTQTHRQAELVVLLTRLAMISEEEA